MQISLHFHLSLELTTDNGDRLLSNKKTTVADVEKKKQEEASKLD